VRTCTISRGKHASRTTIPPPSTDGRGKRLGWNEMLRKCGSVETLVLEVSELSY
jgi:hypothetical protein